MSDVRDFLGTHPTPDPPAPKPDYTARPRYPSMRLEVSGAPCKLGRCPHPDGHHAGPNFEPDPMLDEQLVGWTAQHIPAKRDPIDYFCILCWERVPDLKQHTCAVEAILTS